MNEYKNTGFTAGAANNWEGPKTKLDEKAEKGGFALQEVMEGKPVKRQYPPEREDE